MAPIFMYRYWFSLYYNVILVSTDGVWVDNRITELLQTRDYK
jgi:hypothetical protein